jgi:hypothetical protein
LALVACSVVTAWVPHNADPSVMKMSCGNALWQLTSTCGSGEQLDDDRGSIGDRDTTRLFTGAGSVPTFVECTTHSRDGSIALSNQCQVSRSICTHHYLSGDLNKWPMSRRLMS